MMNRSSPTPIYSTTVTRLVLGGAGFFALAIIALRVYVGSDVHPLAGEWFVGPDAYMRMVRVWEWWQGGSWYQSVSARSNWPDGEILHWTRPLDVTLLALASPLWPFVGLHKALFIAGVIVSPVMAALSMWVLVRGTRDLLDLRGQAMLMVLFAFQPITRAYFLAARPDHHGMILLAFCTVLALLLRYAHDPEARRSAPTWAGAAAAFGLWVSVESLTTELFALAALGLPWIVTGDQRWLLGLRRFALTGALVLALMMGVERPPGEWLSAEEYDRLSTVQAVLMALIALGIEFMWRTRVRAGLTINARLGTAAVAGIGASALMALLFPDFFKGPFGAAMDPRLDAMWLGKIQELQPLISADWQSGVGAAQVLGPALWLGVWAGLRHRQRRTGAPFDETMLVLLLAGLLYLPLSMFQLRWGAYFGVTVSVAWAALFQRLLDWRGGPVIGPAPGTPILRVPAVLGLVTLHLFASAALSVLAPDASAKDQAKVCQWRDLAPLLRSEAFGGGAPRVILSHIHQGPEILYRTPHRVIGTPYHRNTNGILDVYTALTTTDAATAREIMTRRHVDFVILCADSAEERHVLKVQGDTMVRKLVTDTAPSWLTKVPLPNGLEAYFRIYRFGS